MLHFLPDGDSLLGDPSRPAPRPSLATEVPVPAALSGSLQGPCDLPPSPGSLPFPISTQGNPSVVIVHFYFETVSEYR